METPSTNASNGKENIENPAADLADGAGVKEKIGDSFTKSLSNLPAKPVEGEDPKPEETTEEEQDENDVLAKMRKNRESIRARLRAQEDRLTRLVRSTSSDGTESFIGQMKQVEDNLKQVAQEKSELEKELERLKNSTNDDEFLKEKMQDIQEGFDKQVKKIQSLQQELDEKNNEIDELRMELVRKLHRIVELEFDLETHEIHYTTYADEQFKLGEEALAELKADSPTGDHHESFSTLGSETSPSKLNSKQARKLISKLLTDLDNIEFRYKEEKLRTSSSIEKMKIENSELRTRVQVLENRAAERGESSENSEEKLDSVDSHSLYMLQRRVETLDAKNTLYRKDIERLKGELEANKRSANEDEKRFSNDIEALRRENDVLKARIQELESKGDSKKKKLFQKKNSKDDGNAQHYTELEKRIHEHHDEFQKLEAAVAIKDRQIATLRKEVANLRLKNISDGNIRDTNYTAKDAEILRSAPVRSRIAYCGDDDTPENDVVAALRKQLCDAQQQLVKKDQELVIERAKAASTAAGLLARITELTGQRADGKAAGKQVPLRFYM